jgi:hypothetical protein
LVMNIAGDHVAWVANHSSDWRGCCHPWWGWRRAEREHLLHNVSRGIDVAVCLSRDAAEVGFLMCDHWNYNPRVSLWERGMEGEENKKCTFSPPPPGSIWFSDEENNHHTITFLPVAQIPCLTHQQHSC